MRRVTIATEGKRVLIGRKGMMLIRLLALSAIATAHMQSSSYFTNSEKDRIATFWNTSGRYSVSAPVQAHSQGPWQVRLNPDASAWLYRYNSVRGIGKGAVGTAAPISSEEVKAWESWIESKISYDKWVAGNAAAEANSRFLGHDITNAGSEVQEPGPEPDRLKSLVGEPPSFASAVAPNEYSVAFPDGDTVTLTDNPQMKMRYPSYRFAMGVRSGGTPVKSLSQGELESIFQAAGVTDSQQRVMKAVSVLEGGFDSVNTYDTGYVSVGLLQFACLSKGSGSLGTVLLREKESDPQAFNQDFRQYGLDVTPAGSLVALDIDSGTVLEGPAAARKIISDKRLIAVFQHAGHKSRAFQVAQVSTAINQYYPGNDAIAVNVNGQVISGRVGDFVRSEAGMATLMDRKVNTGNLGPLASVLSQVGSQCGCRDASDFASHEREIVTAMKYRKDYTQDPSLSQPGGIGSRDATKTYPSRHSSSRFGRSGGGYKKRRA